MNLLVHDTSLTTANPTKAQGCCGKAGHTSPNCRNKDKIPREKWAINKARSNEYEKGPQSFFCAQEANDKDKEKLHRMMSFLWWTKDECLTLEMDDSGIIEWHVDASFAVHSDMRSHTGATLFMGKGAIESASSKQKINTRSSADAEIVAVDDVIARVMWTKLFLEEQGHKINRNIVYQDNKSSILLMKNGRSSAGKRTRHMKIKHFYATDTHNQGDLETQCCSANDMTADHMTKASQGTKCKSMQCILFPSLFK